MTTQQNQSENMETQIMNTTTETATGTEEKMITTMISTGNATLETVVSILEKHNIAYTDLGKDQKDHTVMQLSYKSDQQPVVDDIQLLINVVEDAIAVFTPVTVNFLKAFGQEIEQGLKKLQDKYGNRKLLALEKSQNSK